ncbi:uncharacterized mitochondrial protein AtMg00810-like [Andrographis paniculata]|uniref:uncharacterized mitochondrial protein AtMg00810-like n=1 Tax=Andrographis paniculata TaxID=175694 RepID=UPI0021E7494D|nr:uncharacterized mitochondrial protein AtMg00810-like [Andrographis paniculata]
MAFNNPHSIIVCSLYLIVTALLLCWYMLMTFFSPALTLWKSQQSRNSFYQEFTIKNLGESDLFLGIQITNTPAGPSVSQQKFIDDILDEAGLRDATPCATPFTIGCKLQHDKGDPLPNPENYRRIVGRLLYLTMTRPNIFYVVQQLSQFMASPISLHWKVVQRILKYLKGTKYLELLFPSTGDLNLAAYSDADWGCCLDTIKSLIGYCICLGSCLISWKTKKQPTDSKSSAEAEYCALASTVSELLWLTYLLRDFLIQVSLPIPLYCDNQSTIHMVHNPVHHEKTKHIDIDCHFVRSHFQSGLIEPTFVPSHHQLADTFTKPLSSAALQKFHVKMNLGSSIQVSLEGGVKKEEDGFVTDWAPP